ncbi:MAG: hypothetical protein ACRDHO_06300 [Actinomycetota bacterium]
MGHRTGPVLIRVHGYSRPFLVTREVGDIIYCRDPRSGGTRAFRKDSTGRLCGDCTTRHDQGRRIATSCRYCNALAVNSTSSVS